MVIGAEDEPLAGALADPLEVVLAAELLLLLLLHAARTPTQSATAPSAAAFLENQGRLALTPGSSFLIAHICSESSSRMSLGARFRELTSGFHAPCDKHGKMRAAVTSSARTRKGDNRLHERLARFARFCQSRISNFLLRNAQRQDFLMVELAARHKRRGAGHA